MEKESASTAKAKNGVEQLNLIRDELLQTLKDLREKIQTLEAERTKLAGEVESLRKAAEARATALEVEVSQIRGDIKTLRELLG